jgi:hypothetical protein
MDGTTEETLSEASNIKPPLFAWAGSSLKKPNPAGKQKTTISSGSTNEF